MAAPRALTRCKRDRQPCCMWTCGPAPTSATAGNFIRSFDKRTETAHFVFEGIRGGEGSESLRNSESACKKLDFPGCPDSTGTSDFERTQGPQALGESNSTYRPGLKRPLRIIGCAGLGVPKASGERRFNSMNRDTHSSKAALKICAGSDLRPAADWPICLFESGASASTPEAPTEMTDGPLARFFV